MRHLGARRRAQPQLQQLAAGHAPAAAANAEQLAAAGGVAFMQRCLVVGGTAAVQHVRTSAVPPWRRPEQRTSKRQHSKQNYSKRQQQACAVSASAHHSLAPPAHAAQRGTHPSAAHASTPAGASAGWHVQHLPNNSSNSSSSSRYLSWVRCCADESRLERRPCGAQSSQHRFYPLSRCAPSTCAPFLLPTCAPFIDVSKKSKTKELFCTHLHFLEDIFFLLPRQ